MSILEKDISAIVLLDINEEEEKNGEKFEKELEITQENQYAHSFNQDFIATQKLDLTFCEKKYGLLITDILLPPPKLS